MIFPQPLRQAVLIRRYKRFLADVRLPDGRTITVHCPNTGALLGCAEPGFPVWLLDSDNPRRKYAFTWELVEVKPGTLVGINTGRANRLVEEALGKDLVPGVEGYTSLAREVRYGRERSRVDFLLTGDDLPPCYLEVKNVNAAVTDGVALFPDAVTARGTRHMRELVGMVAQGARGVVCFCVQRGDVREVRPADGIDPDYGRALREAVDQGVEVVALRADLSPRDIALRERVPVVL